MTIAERIDNILKEKKLSRRQLAIMAGIPTSTFQSAMQRNGQMSTDMLRKIASALDMPVFNLLHSDDEIRRITSLFAGVGGTVRPIHPLVHVLASEGITTTKESEMLDSIIDIYYLLDDSGKAALYHRALELKKLNGLTLENLEEE